MVTVNEYQTGTTDFIKKQLHLLNGAILLSVVVALFLVVKFAYQFLDYIPPETIVALVAILAGLSVVGMIGIKLITRKAIGAIDAYSERLNSLLGISRQCQEIEHSDEMLRFIAATAARMTGADSSMVILAEGDGCTVKASVENGEAAHAAPSPLLAEIVRGCIKSNSVFNGTCSSSASNGQDTACIVPLGGKCGVFGAVQVCKEHGSFDRESEEVLRYVADYASRAYMAASHCEDERNYEIHVTNILVNAMENHVERSGHSSNVTNYALLIANQMDLPTDRKLLLHKAALLHDIGALKLPKEMHTAAEYRKHAQYGYELLRPITFYADLAPLVLHHHEWFDGQGYPHGLRGSDIPLESRIISVAEAFDAIINKCAYAKWQSPFDDRNIPDVSCFHDALEVLMAGAGTQFDPSIVRVLERALDAQEIECLCNPEAHAA